MIGIFESLATQAAVIVVIPSPVPQTIGSPKSVLKEQP
jgi:hypothetical protein